MKAVYTFLQKILKLCVNAIFVVQIVLSVTVFIVTVYWFMSLLGWSFFDFAKPIADWAIGLVKTFLPGEMILMPGVSNFDPALLYFDLVALLCVYLGDKLKLKIYETMTHLESSYDIEKHKEEYRFNDELRKEYAAAVQTIQNAGVLVEFDLKLLHSNMYYDEDLSEKLHEREQTVLDAFYNQIRADYQCERAGNKVFVVCEFARADRLLKRIDEITDQLGAALEQQQWVLDKYVSAEGYDKLSKEVLIALEGLLNLRLLNKVVCYSNFVMRYEAEPQRSYDAVIFQKYDQDVWMLVKRA